MLRNLAAFLIAPALIPAQIAFAQNSQLNYNQRLGLTYKPAVARLSTLCEGSYTYKYNGKQYTSKLSEFFLGSGYFVNSDGYLLTTANVARFAQKDGKACDEYLKEKLVNQVTDQLYLSEAEKKKVKESIKLKEKIKNPGKVFLPIESTYKPFDFNVKELGTDEGLSNDVAIIKIALTNAPVLELADSNTVVNLQDDVLVIGYPTAADTENLNYQSILEASVTEGKVSNPNKRLQDNSPVLQIGAQVAQGSSGSPVLNNQGKVIGMITLGSKDQSEQNPVPIAIPSSTLKEFIIQSGLTNKEGVVDRKYKDGLESFWKGDYKAAKDKFVAVKGLFPQHSEVNRLISESDQKIADISDKIDYTPWLIGIGAFLAGTTAVLLFMNLRKRNVAGSTELIESTEYLQEPTHELQESTVVEQVERAPSLQVVSGSVSNIYRPATVMSGLGTRSSTYLELRNPQGGVQRLNLQGERYQIGRDRDWSNIDLTEPAWNVLSWHHAVLKKEGQNYRIYDGDGTKLSTNRIWINNTPINPQEGHLLQDEDQLKIGLDPENQVTLIYKNPTSKESVA